MDERVGGAEEDGQSLTVVGRMLRPGEPAPDFTLDHFHGSGMSSVALGDLSGSTVVLNVVNSVDTPVCDIQTRRIDSLFPHAKVLTVSMDLSFALARWTAAAGVTHPAVSSHRSEDFGQEYGVLIKEWRAQTLRADWTFGTHRLQWHDIDLPGSAAGALAFLERAAAS